MTQTGEYHVLIRPGDAEGEVERLVAEAGSAEAAGLHRYFYVSRANQTVVMTVGENAPIAAALRRAGGWKEPEATPGERPRP